MLNFNIHNIQAIHKGVMLMKQTAFNTRDMLYKIELIEKEIYSLKQSVLKEISSSGNKRVIKLRGILKGVKITDKDILSAKKSLYGRISV